MGPRNHLDQRGHRHRVEWTSSGWTSGCLRLKPFVLYRYSGAVWGAALSVPHCGPARTLPAAFYRMASHSLRSDSSECIQPAGLDIQPWRRLENTEVRHADIYFP